MAKSRKLSFNVGQPSMQQSWVQSLLKLSTCSRKLTGAPSAGCARTPRARAVAVRCPSAGERGDQNPIFHTLLFSKRVRKRDQQTRGEAGQSPRRATHAARVPQRTPPPLPESRAQPQVCGVAGMICWASQGRGARRQPLRCSIRRGPVGMCTAWGPPAARAHSPRGTRRWRRGRSRTARLQSRCSWAP